MYALYRLHKTNIAFENHCLIVAKSFKSAFNHPKFYAIIYFIKCIKDYGSAINYTIVYRKIILKYLFKVFYEQTNEKKYKSEIFKHNI